MSWERRKAGSYYYRARKVDGRVVKEYAGGGLLGELAEEEELARRAEREEDLKQFGAAQREARADAEFYRLLESEIARALTEAGYHRPKRGRWRKKR